jgi:hypothetical protein
MMVVELERDTPEANGRALFNCFLCNLKPHDGLSAKKTVERRRPSISSTRQTNRDEFRIWLPLANYSCNRNTIQTMSTIFCCVCIFLGTEVLM